MLKFSARDTVELDRSLPQALIKTQTKQQNRQCQNIWWKETTRAEENKNPGSRVVKPSAWDQSTALGSGSSSNSLASKMFSSSPSLICMWEAKRQVLGLVGSKQNVSVCAGLEEGGSHTDSGARASNGLIVLSQSCLQKFVGQVVPSDYPNNLKEEEKRKKKKTQVSIIDAPLRDVHGRAIVLYNSQKRGTVQAALDQCWVRVGSSSNLAKTTPLPLPALIYRKDTALTTHKQLNCCCHV